MGGSEPSALDPEMAARVNALISAMAEKDASHDAAMAQKETMIAEKNALIAEKDDVIAEKDAAIASGRAT